MAVETQWLAVDGPRLTGWTSPHYAIFAITCFSTV